MANARWRLAPAPSWRASRDGRGGRPRVLELRCPSCGIAAPDHPPHELPGVLRGSALLPHVPPLHGQRHEPLRRRAGRAAGPQGGRQLLRLLPSGVEQLPRRPAGTARASAGELVRAVLEPRNRCGATRRGRGRARCRIRGRPDRPPQAGRFVPLEAMPVSGSAFDRWRGCRCA